MTHVPDDLPARVAAAITPLHGWTTPEKGVRLAELVIETGAAVSVEIGVFGGRGTIAMALGHQALGRGYVAGIDSWSAQASLEGSNEAANDEWWAKVDYDAVYEHCLAALLRCGVARHVRIMRERSDTALRLFADESVSVLHQDGNHSREVSTAEVGMWAPKLARGGYWVADDTDWTTTQEALALLVEQGFTLVEDHGGWRVYRKP
ncbi:MAG TPA: class I SAM-dependent methyltransferase [Vicinamibacterales bacterium]|nr:class I SAM-dependent methyltransferase [Vicinamibacterales bacterium]